MLNLDQQYCETECSLSEMNKIDTEDMLQYLELVKINLAFINKKRNELAMPEVNPKQPTTVLECIQLNHKIWVDYSYELIRKQKQSQAQQIEQGDNNIGGQLIQQGHEELSPQQQTHQVEGLYSLPKESLTVQQIALFEQVPPIANEMLHISVPSESGASSHTSTLY